MSKHDLTLKNALSKLAFILKFNDDYRNDALLELTQTFATHFEEQGYKFPDLRTLLVQASNKYLDTFIKQHYKELLTEEQLQDALNCTGLDRTLFQTCENEDYALDLTIQTWKYLRDHPELKSKDELPNEILEKIKSYPSKCAMCSCYVSCERCPLYFSYDDNGGSCADNNVLNWGIAKTDSDRALYAGAVVQLLMEIKRIKFLENNKDIAEQQIINDNYYCCDNIIL